MGVEFKLARQDHKKVEDFLARRPAGVTGITIDAHRTRTQAAAAEAARAAGLEVLVEPLTERLTAIGFDPGDLPYYSGQPIDLVRLRRDQSAREALTEQVLQAQEDIATTIVPPHFYVHDDRSAWLNAALARRAARMSKDRPVRPIVIIQRKYAMVRGRALANAYVDSGIERIELRVTPCGGEDEGTHKIRSVFSIADAFRVSGLDVVLGCSGNIGQTALALGHVTGFSVGVGMREKVDHKGTMSRQVRSVDDDDDGPFYGPQAGVYLPGAALTVRRATAHALLSDRDIRTRIGCRIGGCAHDIAGPASDPRAHYLHARAHEVAQLLARPAAWRPTMEQDRLERAIELREIINAHHLPPETAPFKTRTLRGLLAEIDHEQRMSA